MIREDSNEWITMESIVIPSIATIPWLVSMKARSVDWLGVNASCLEILNSNESIVKECEHYLSSLHSRIMEHMGEEAKVLRRDLPLNLKDYADEVKFARLAAISCLHASPQDAASYLLGLYRSPVSMKLTECALLNRPTLLSSVFPMIMEDLVKSGNNGPNTRKLAQLVYGISNSNANMARMLQQYFLAHKCQAAHCFEISYNNLRCTLIPIVGGIINSMDMLKSHWFFVNLPKTCVMRLFRHTYDELSKFCSSTTNSIALIQSELLAYVRIGAVCLWLMRSKEWLTMESPPDSYDAAEQPTTVLMWLRLIATLWRHTSESGRPPDDGDEQRTKRQRTGDSSEEVQCCIAKLALASCVHVVLLHSSPEQVLLDKKTLREAEWQDVEALDLKQCLHSLFGDILRSARGSFHLFLTITLSFNNFDGLVELCGDIMGFSSSVGMELLLEPISSQKQFNRGALMQYLRGFGACKMSESAAMDQFRLIAVPGSIRRTFMCQGDWMYCFTAILQCDLQRFCGDYNYMRSLFSHVLRHASAEDPHPWLMKAISAFVGRSNKVAVSHAAGGSKVPSAFLQNDPAVNDCMLSLLSTSIVEHTAPLLDFNLTETLYVLCWAHNFTPKAAAGVAEEGEEPEVNEAAAISVSASIDDVAAHLMKSQVGIPLSEDRWRRINKSPQLADLLSNSRAHAAGLWSAVLTVLYVLLHYKDLSQMPLALYVGPLVADIRQLPISRALQVLMIIRALSVNDDEQLPVLRLRVSEVLKQFVGALKVSASDLLQPLTVRHVYRSIAESCDALPALCKQHKRMSFTAAEVMQFAAEAAGSQDPVVVLATQAVEIGRHLRTMNQKEQELLLRQHLLPHFTKLDSRQIVDLWMSVHKFCANHWEAERHTVNAFFHLQHATYGAHPVAFVSYERLIQEPIALFRLHFRLLSHPAVFSIVAKVLETLALQSRLRVVQQLTAKQNAVKFQKARQQEHQQVEGGDENKQPVNIPSNSLLEATVFIQSDMVIGVQEQILARLLLAFCDELLAADRAAKAGVVADGSSAEELDSSASVKQKRPDASLQAATVRNKALRLLESILQRNQSLLGHVLKLGFSASNVELMMKRTVENRVLPVLLGKALFKEVAEFSGLASDALTKQQQAQFLLSVNVVQRLEILLLVSNHFLLQVAQKYSDKGAGSKSNSSLNEELTKQSAVLAPLLPRLVYCCYNCFTVFHHVGLLAQNETLLLELLPTLQRFHVAVHNVFRQYAHNKYEKGNLEESLGWRRMKERLALAYSEGRKDSN